MLIRAIQPSGGEQEDTSRLQRRRQFQQQRSASSSYAWAMLEAGIRATYRCFRNGRQSITTSTLVSAHVATAASWRHIRYLRPILQRTLPIGRPGSDPSRAGETTQCSNRRSSRRRWGCSWATRALATARAAARTLQARRLQDSLRPTYAPKLDSFSPPLSLSTQSHFDKR